MGFVPRSKCGWSHRFDDIEREYRTLYCAEQRITALRETLAGFRPKLRALREYRELFGSNPPKAGAVTGEWLEKHVLAPAKIRLASGDLLDVDEPGLRRDFGAQHLDLLLEHGFEHLDISEVRSRERVVTQTLSHWCHERGAAGISYRSNLDGTRNIALFEGRAALILDGPVEPLDRQLDELETVCREFRLTLQLD